MWPIKAQRIHTAGDLYLTRYSCALLPGYFLHVFNRGDSDPDPHDHPWAFATFPLVAYVEEVWEHGLLTRRMVSAGRWHHRNADYCHRLLGSFWKPAAGDGPNVRNEWNVIVPRSYLPWYTRLAWLIFGAGKVITIVKHGPATRNWGFRRRVVSDNTASWVWVGWKQYIDSAKTWLDH